MAGIARLRERAGYVVRIGRALEIFQVARDARGGVQIVVIVRVAVGAGARRNGMCARQDKVHQRVIEGRRRPGNGGMALLAGCWEISGCVAGITRVLKVRKVARYASRAGQVVIVIDVAINALPGWNRVSSSQWKPNRTMIEFRVQPTVGRVAGFAGGRELCRNVTRVRGLLKIGGVAGVALR